jgi:GDP-L-fucose synthase
MNRDSRIYIAGHRGLVGNAILQRLEGMSCTALLTRTREQLDLCNPHAVNAFFDAERPEFVFLAAAQVGGIAANRSFPADFIRDNLLIQTNVIDAAQRYAADKLLLLASSAIYPRDCPQPMREQHLLTGPPEPSNDAYAIAKIAGITFCQACHRQFGSRFISVVPTNLYGPGDHFDLDRAHVMPAMIRRFHEARTTGAHQLILWGSGTPRREFLHANDLADACLMLMERYESPDIINVGSGEELTIRQLAELVGEVVGFTGEIHFDPEKPDGAPRKLLDIGRLSAFGWRPRISLRDGIEQTYRWYLAQAGAM